MIRPIILFLKEKYLHNQKNRDVMETFQKGRYCLKKRII